MFLGNKFYGSFSLNLQQKPAIFLFEKKLKHSREDKTHETLTRKILFGIRLSVTKVTVFETSEGIGERSRETLGENNGRAVCSCYDARR